jgi:hypothetical protein
MIDAWRMPAAVASAPWQEVPFQARCRQVGRHQGARLEHRLDEDCTRQFRVCQVGVQQRRLDERHRPCGPHAAQIGIRQVGAVETAGVIEVQRQVKASLARTRLAPQKPEPYP